VNKHRAQVHLLRAMAVVVMVNVMNSPATAQEAIELRWHLPAGEQFKLSFTQGTEIVTTVGNKAIRLRVDHGAELQWLVQQVDEAGNMQIEQTISRLSIKMSKSDGTEEIAYDSASTERARGAARDFASAAGPLVGLKVQIALSSRGEILAVNIPAESAEIIEKIRDRSKVATLFTPAGLSEVLKQALPLLPEKAVSAGDSWEQPSQKVISSGKLAQITKLIYAGLDDTAQPAQHKIELKGDATLTPSPDKTNKLTLKQQQMTGTLWYSPDEYISRGSIHQELVTEEPYRDEMITTRLRSQLDFSVTEEKNN
jgi:hypothetical protein